MGLVAIGSNHTKKSLTSRWIGWTRCQDKSFVNLGLHLEAPWKCSFMFLLLCSQSLRSYKLPRIPSCICQGTRHHVLMISATSLSRAPYHPKHIAHYHHQDPDHASMYGNRVHQCYSSGITGYWGGTYALKPRTDSWAFQFHPVSQHDKPSQITSSEVWVPRRARNPTQSFNQWSPWKCCGWWPSLIPNQLRWTKETVEIIKWRMSEWT